MTYKKNRFSDVDIVIEQKNLETEHARNKHD